MLTVHGILHSISVPEQMIRFSLISAMSFAPSKGLIYHLTFVDM